MKKLSHNYIVDIYLQLLKYWILCIALVDGIVIMKAYKGETNMATITFIGTIQSITPFERENTHVKLQYPEQFVAITLRGDDGRFFVTFTRKHATFAKSVAVGMGGQFTGKFKREQNYANQGGQVVLTNMVCGTYSYQGVEEKRVAKKLARAHKLGLA